MKINIFWGELTDVLDQKITGLNALEFVTYQPLDQFIFLKLQRAVTVAPNLKKCNDGHPPCKHTMHHNFLRRCLNSVQYFMN